MIRERTILGFQLETPSVKTEFQYILKIIRHQKFEIKSTPQLVLNSNNTKSQLKS